MHTFQSKNPFIDFLSQSLYDHRTVNFWLKKFNPLWSTNQTLGKIVEKQKVSDNVVSLKILCNQRMQFGKAGQHHPVIIEISGRRYERTYSLTQLDQQHVLLTLKKVENGIVSSWLCQQAKVGDMIEFGTPYGDMLIENQQNKKLILLAAGSGITPMYSMLYALANSNQLQDYQIHLLYWAQHQQDLAFKAQFEAWQQQYPQFKFSSFCTQDEPKAARLSESHLATIDDLSQYSVFACGSSGFVQQAKALAINANDFQAEAFSLTPISNDETGFINITLAKSNKTIAIAKGQPILVGLEQAQIKPTHGCRMGICNKCACRKVEGSTRNLNDQSENHEPNQDLRICVNTARNDLILDL